MPTWLTVLIAIAILVIGAFAGIMVMGLGLGDIVLNKAVSKVEKREDKP